MGVGEDEDLGEAIAVTVIATGFNVDQQDDIVNTESKKIIHTLEDEQKAQHDLTSNRNIVHHLVEEEEKREPIIKHTLIEEEPEELGMDLIKTTNYIKNFNVFYEEVVEKVDKKKDVFDDDFVIIESGNPIRDIEVVDPITVEFDRLKEEQMAMSFDMPLAQTDEVEEEEKENVITFSLDDDINDIEVKSPVEVSPVLEFNKQGETRYSLDDYMDLEDNLNNAKPQQKQEPVEEEMQIERKAVEHTPRASHGSGQTEVDPMNSPIEELLRERADERRKKLKDFNYKFQNSVNTIEESEKVPAYKRQGIDLNDSRDQEGRVSRTTLGSDSNDEIQLRSNNSFLHDNVD